MADFKTRVLRSSVYLPLAALSASLAACPGPDPEPMPPGTCSADTFVPGLEKTSAAGVFAVRLESVSPAPPKLGDNTWTLRFVDAAGSPIAVENARLEARMPDRQQGTLPPVHDIVPREESTRYDAGPFTLLAEGRWEMTIEATLNGVLDRATFSFCVEGWAEDAGVPDAGAPADAAMPIECNLTAPVECTDRSLSYANVQPIIMERCLSCHDGAHGQWPLTTYDHVVDWFAEIRGMVLACTMPPPAAQIPMTTEEREVILLWLRCGYPP
jgi:hypothetical protein